MIAFLIYLGIILFIIYTNKFLSIFNDTRVTRKQFSILFLLKTLAVPAFFLVYKKLYGGIDNLDAGKFYNDVNVIQAFGKSDLVSYLKLLFGLQNETEGSYEYISSHLYTHNWDNGTTKDYLYNDNRVLIRVYSIFHFLPFSNYFVLSLWSCFLSFIGIIFIYKSFKQHFIGKEMFLLMILCFFPALWFYTGALLKEGITILVFGSFIYLLKKIIENKFQLTTFLLLCFLLFISSLLKPYLLLLSFFVFTMYFLLQQNKKVKRKCLWFIAIFLVVLLTVNFLSIQLKGRSLMQAAFKHQRIFSGVAKGGIFLSNDSKFVRLNFDTSLVKQVENKKDVFTINKNAPFMYWQNNRLEDTLFCNANSDTISQYFLIYKIAESSSNIKAAKADHSLIKMIGASLYYSLVFPFFYNAKSVMHWLASFENLILLLSLLISLVAMFTSKKSVFLPFVFIFLFVCIAFLIGLATPNSGAIFRYRSPVAVFIILSALYYINLNKGEKLNE